jgi:hypothetical protein
MREIALLKRKVIEEEDVDRYGKYIAAVFFPSIVLVWACYFYPWTENRIRTEFADVMEDLNERLPRLKLPDQSKPKSTSTSVSAPQQK